MASKVDILKIFKPHLLLNGQNLVGGIGVTWRFRIFIAKNILLWYPWWLPMQPSWRSYIFSSPGGFAPTWRLCSRSAYAVVFRMCINNFSHFHHLHQNCIHDGCHRGHLISLQLLSATEQYVCWSRNLVEGIRAAWRYRIAKMVLFWYPRWPPWQSSWKYSNHVCSGMVGLIELKHDGRH